MLGQLGIVGIVEMLIGRGSMIPKTVTVKPFRSPQSMDLYCPPLRVQKDHQLCILRHVMNPSMAFNPFRLPLKVAAG